MTSRPPEAPPALVVLVDSFPELSETFVVEEARALTRAGARVRIEALEHARTPRREPLEDLAVSYAVDDPLARRLTDLVWLVARHPLACLRDLAARPRWRREEWTPPLRALAPLARRLARGGERHLHAHFAAGAALVAIRLGGLLGVPASVTAHAYDIFKSPRNLRAKLRRAAFTTTGCEYNVGHLRALAGGRDAARIHEVIMGVDGDRFRRRRPHPVGRTVLAVGRLVEKKGFAHLLDAAARLEPGAPLERLRIVGEGPLRASLQDRIRRLGLEHRVELLGAREPEEVRELLEAADVLAMPCVVSADGDRDSMPVVVKEALAMEVPVVASDEVGLPELVRPEWGRLVAPGDPAALAGAIAEVLALEPERRAAMGAAGRAFVLERCDVGREVLRLLDLIAAAGEER